MGRLSLLLLLLPLLCAYANAAAVVLDMVANKSTPLEREAPGNNFWDRVRRANDGDGELKVHRGDLKDLYQRALIQWSGGGSDVIFVVTQNFDQSNNIAASHQYRTKDYGMTFDDETAKFDKTAVITRMYSSPHSRGHLIFVSESTKTLYITEDEGETFVPSSVPFTPSELSVNDYIDGVVLAHDTQEHAVYVSRDRGHSWSPALGDSSGHHYVNAFFWSREGAGHSDANDTLYLEVEADGNKDTAELIRIPSAVKAAQPQAYPAAAAGEDLTPKNTPSPLKGTFEVYPQYMFFRTRVGASLRLYVSYQRGDFQRAEFSGPDKETAYVVLDANEEQVFVAVLKDDGRANVYISERFGLRFSLSLEHIAMSNGQRFNVDAFADFYEVQGIEGVYLATQLNEQGEGYTLVTYDKGAEWARVQAPDNACPKGSKTCGLNLDLEYASRLLRQRFDPVISRTSAPGFILANGNVGKSINTDVGVYMSSDAGYTWTDTGLGDQYQLLMLDHGGVMVAAHPYDGQLSDSIYYSIDEGRTWVKEQVSDDQLHFVALLTEPGEATTLASIWAYAPTARHWTVVHVDFADILGNGRACNASDYVTWSPKDDESPLGCLLGRKLLYERRAPLARCVNGIDYDRPIAAAPCECLTDDFECDFGFERVDADAPCKPVNDSVTPVCHPGETITVSRGYRKVAGDGCQGGLEVLIQPLEYKCPDRCPLKQWSAWAPCDVCNGNGFTTRTREPLNDDVDKAECPCLFEQKECERPGLAGRVSIVPGEAHFALGEDAVLAAVLRDNDLQCGEGDGVFGSLKFLWQLGDAEFESDMDKAALVKEQVLEGVRFREGGVYNVQLSVSNTDDHTLVTNNIVVYVDDMWIAIDYALPTGDNVPSAQGLQSLLAEKFSGVLSQHSDFRVELIDQLMADALSDRIRLRFRALDSSRAASGDHAFLKQLLADLQTLSAKDDLSVKVGGSGNVVLHPIAGSVRQIKAPDGSSITTQAPPKDTSSSGGSGSKLTSTVVPIVIVAVFVIAALVVLQQRRMQQLRRRYLRLEAQDPDDDGQLLVDDGEAGPQVMASPARREDTSVFVPHGTREMAANSFADMADEHDDDELLEELEQMELADELVDITGVEGASGAAGSSSGVRAAAPVPLAVPRTIPAQQAAKRAEEERELDELVALQASMKTEQPMPMPMSARELGELVTLQSSMKVEHPPMPRPIMAAVHPSMKIEQAMPMPMMAAVF